MRTRRYLFALVILLSVCTALFAGGSKESKGSSLSFGTYSNASQYNIGDAVIDPSYVKSLDVNWVSGSISVIYGNVRGIEISETSDKGPIPEDEQMRWYVDNGVLRIQFLKSGLNLTTTRNKDLKVVVPKNVDFAEVEIGTVSSDAVVNVEASVYDFEGVSADFTLECSSVARIDVETVSGKIEVRAKACPSKLDFESVSGDMKLFVPSSSGFTATFGSVSGKMNCTIPVTLSGKKYIAGDGKADFDFDTVSGDVTVSAI